MQLPFRLLKLIGRIPPAVLTLIRTAAATALYRVARQLDPAGVAELLGATAVPVDRGSVERMSAIDRENARAVSIESIADKLDELGATEEAMRAREHAGIVREIAIGGRRSAINEAQPE